VAERPYTVLSCAVSIDGFLDDATGSRLVLSNDADLDRVVALRAGCDAILVGAGTVRADNPKLLVRSQTRRDARTAAGLPSSPVKVTVTAGGQLDVGSRFFTTGDGLKFVYCATSGLTAAFVHLSPVATVVDGGQPVDLRRMCEDLSTRGIRRLLVEGGGGVLRAFLSAGLADELQLVVAPVFVGAPTAPRLIGDGRPVGPGGRGRAPELVDVRRIEDRVLLRYSLSERFVSSAAAA
jgi:5-amino-6-(5-phosphoribosylamino)uracil reductase